MSNVIKFPPRKADDVPAYLEALAKKFRDEKNTNTRFIMLVEDDGSMSSTIINYPDQITAIGVIECIKVNLVLECVAPDD